MTPEELKKMALEASKAEFELIEGHMKERLRPVVFLALYESSVMGLLLS